MITTQKVLEKLDMLSNGSGLLCVHPTNRSAQQTQILNEHPWRTRLHAYLAEAKQFRADWVYFRLSVGAGAPRPELFIYDWQDHGLCEKQHVPPLATLYHQLWNYGRVPLAVVLRRTKVDIYNLLPPPEFDEAGSPKEPPQIESLSLTPADTLALAGAAAKGVRTAGLNSWKRFSAQQFDSGAFWESEQNRGFATGSSSLDSLVSEMRDVRRSLEKHTNLGTNEDQKSWFVRRLLIITLMVRFLEARKILPDRYFNHDESPEPETFSSLLRQPRSLLRAIKKLERDFNGDVFHVDPSLTELLSNLDANALVPMSNFAAGNMEGQQAHFWHRYSFQHLPVEVISYVYEDFLQGKSQAYFTPYHLVELLLDEAMPEKDILAALSDKDRGRGRSKGTYPVLDPACGSGVFLVGAWRRLVDAFTLSVFLHAIRPYMPFFAAFGPRYLVGRQTAMLKKDIMDLPYPEDGQLIFRGVQKYLCDDVIDFMIPLIKDTDSTRTDLEASAKESEVKAYAKVFGKLMDSIYSDFNLVGIYDLDTGWCVAFHKGKRPATAFGNAKALKGHINALLSNETGRALRAWRIVRHFSGDDLFIIKPKPRRYWLKSAAIADADQTFAWVMKRRPVAQNNGHLNAP